VLQTYCHIPQERRHHTKQTTSLSYFKKKPESLQAIQRSVSSIDNIFLDRSGNNNFIIEPYYNRLSDHNALMLTLTNLSHKLPESGWVRTGDTIITPP
jgi:hypothetical protein